MSLINNEKEINMNSNLVLLIKKSWKFNEHRKQQKKNSRTVANDVMNASTEYIDLVLTGWPKPVFENLRFRYRP